MAKKRHTAEQIISKLREAEVLLATGTKMPSGRRSRTEPWSLCRCVSPGATSPIADIAEARQEFRRCGREEARFRRSCVVSSAASQSCPPIGARRRFRSRGLLC